MTQKKGDGSPQWWMLTHQEDTQEILSGFPTRTHPGAFHIEPGQGDWALSWLMNLGVRKPEENCGQQNLRVQLAVLERHRGGKALFPLFGIPSAHQEGPKLGLSLMKRNLFHSLGVYVHENTPFLRSKSQSWPRKP